ncbi:MAG TPA: IPT/TIG domain-containing protein [Terriglobales bacterium]|nr:IPT/TIG domain-containing protein [Terriglobales bacterium]
MAACSLFRTATGVNRAKFHLVVKYVSHELDCRELVRVLRSLLCVLGAGIVISFVLPQLVRAGGPRYVAGVSYFAAGTKGVPLTWAQGAINYYTDQGDLSPILPGPTADAFVASAFSQWTSIPTAAVSATQAGHLAEDVSGANVIVNSDGTITVPSDILPGAVSTPVGIVYDLDGSVTDALLGQGAGSASSCFTNAAFGGIDNFGTNANFLHALVILNGNCAQTSAQLPDVQYRLVRVLGRVLGLDWSQANVNVFTRNPAPTSADYAGFTIMHATDPINCVPISLCYPNADVPKMDDQAALSRLYPVTTQNQANFSGKQLFYETTIRIQGSVCFVDANGQPAQPMQGVNVVARWIDPATGQPSRQYVAASVSGFLFAGNAGNPATGFNDSTGQPFNRFGSDDPSVEGSFDLAGLQIPNSASSAQYQLSVEAIDALWSQPVGPYGPFQVQPSGTAQPIIVTASPGSNVQQDILMQGSAIQNQDFFEPTSYASPAAVPSEGDWMGSLSGYGNADYFSFPGQANRTLSVEVTALDESAAASESKAQPVIGMWALADPGTFPAPALTPSAFNTLLFGETRLDAILLGTTNFRMGIFDYRGDGRPDYRYHAHVFYGDNITPARASVAGGTALTVQGLGFRPNTTASIAAANAPVLAVTANRVTVSTPAEPDGVQSLVLSDPATGASSTLTNALTYGAGPSDTIKLLAGSNPSTPVGGQAPNPIRVQVLAPDGVTPVAGASVFFTATPAVAFSTCGGAGSCTVLTDQSGQVTTFVTVLTAATMTISAVLAPASYPAPQQVQTTLLGTSSSLDIALAPAFAWIAQGATLDVPLAARVLSNGAPLSGRTVNYFLTKGSATFSSTTATTDVNGYSNTTLHLSALAGDVQVSACVGPGNSPCQSFNGTAVPASALQLHPVAGNIQLVPVGQIFQPVTVRVTDSSTPPNPVVGAGVAFQSVISRSAPAPPITSLGEITITRNPTPVIISSSQVSVPSDVNGLATIQPSTSGVQGAVVVQGTAAAGNSTLQFELQSLWPVSNPGAGEELRVLVPKLHPMILRHPKEQ